MAGMEIAEAGRLTRAPTVRPAAMDGMDPVRA